MTNNPVLQFAPLKRRLWLGTGVYQAVFLAVVLAFWPQFAKQAVFGAGAGVFYLWSLIFSAEHPRRKVQFVFSLIRIVVFAYLIVTLAGARVPELAIVMCGLLGYKVILTVEYVAQALPAFRPRQAGPADTAENVD